jgi:hypothetical protein
MGGISLFHLLIILIFVCGVYLLPTWIALSRRHHNRGAIIALDVLLGWTVFGWFGALVWSLATAKNSA